MGLTDGGGVSRFGELLQDGGFQESFRKSPADALEAAGVAAEGLPGDLLDVVAGLSREELALFVKIQGKLGGIDDGAGGVQIF